MNEEDLKVESDEEEGNSDGEGLSINDPDILEEAIQEISRFDIYRPESSLLFTMW